MLVSSVFDEIAATSSRNEKEAVLAKHGNNCVKQILYFAYNPFLRFNLDSQVESMEGTGTEQLNISVLTIILDDLATRKVTGNDAVALVGKYIADHLPQEATLIKNIIKKDLRCGISDSTINKVFKDLIPTFDVQLAQKPERINKMTYPAYVQPKFDGMRCVAIYDGTDVEFLSRAGKPITTVDYMKADIIRLANGVPVVFDGELMSDTFNATMSGVKRKTQKNQDARFYIFDVIPFDDFAKGVCNHALSDRMTHLSMLWDYKQLEFLRFPTYSIVKSEAEARELYGKFREDGYEGAIVKKMNGNYQFKRCDNWIKLKPKETLDLEIIGYEEGTGKYVGKLGAFIVDYKGNPVRVGTGFSDAQREEFWAVRNEMISYIIELSFMEETTNERGIPSLRHPVFERVRTIKGSKA